MPICRRHSRIWRNAFAAGRAQVGGKGQEIAARVVDKAKRTRLARLRAAMARLERMSRNATSTARRQDTREKIELGGLIVKAGLRLEKRAVLLGALIELQQRLRSDESERNRLTTIGARAFGHEGE